MLDISVSYPRSAGRYPVIVFFHGALCSAAGYMALADEWASRGYVVILPQHPNPTGSRPQSDKALLEFLEQVQDMSSVLDSLEVISSRLESPGTQMDGERVVAAGHSMGALIAAAVSGLARTGVDGAPENFHDERFDIAVLLSGPGPLPNTPPGAWDKLTVPLLVTTGTRDHANQTDNKTNWRWRLGAFELTPPGDKHALIVDSADHFLGGMLCAERVTGEPDQEAFAIVSAVTGDFIDAHIKADAAAKTRLNAQSIASASGNRAELLSR
jgi:dienelactone hydrolase